MTPRTSYAEILPRFPLRLPTPPSMTSLSTTTPDPRNPTTPHPTWPDCKSGAISKPALTTSLVDSPNSARNVAFRTQGPPAPAAAMTTTEQRSPVAPQSFVESLESSSKSIENAPSFLINSKNKPPAVIQSPPSPALRSNRCTSHKFHVLTSLYYLPSCSLPLPPSLTYKRHYSVNLLGPHNLHCQQFTTLQLW